MTANKMKALGASNNIIKGGFEFGFITIKQKRVIKIILRDKGLSSTAGQIFELVLLCI